MQLYTSIFCLAAAWQDWRTRTFAWPWLLFALPLAWPFHISYSLAFCLFCTLYRWRHPDKLGLADVCFLWILSFHLGEALIPVVLAACLLGVLFVWCKTIPFVTCLGVAVTAFGILCRN
jgi:hypothetical protein